jgi:hypothetical protein
VAPYKLGTTTGFQLYSRRPERKKLGTFFLDSRLSFIPKQAEQLEHTKTPLLGLSRLTLSRFPDSFYF